MEPHPSYSSVLLWSLIILLSFWGWGEALRQLLNRKEFSNLGWGLTMAWGMAVTLALGGLLMAFSLATAPVLLALVIAGALGAVFFLSAPPKDHAAPAAKKNSQKSSHSHKQSQSAPREPDSRFSSLQRLAQFALWTLAALAFASSIAWPFQIDPNDDIVCYLFFPEKILQTGSLIEPFNVRRMGTYGGQSLLQALVMIVGGERNGHVPDRGFGMLIVFGILLEISRRLNGNNLTFRVLILSALFFVPVPRINTSSSLTGAAIFLGLLLALEKAPKSGVPGWRFSLVPALFVAAAGAIRPTYFLFTVFLVAVFSFMRAIEQGGGALSVLRSSLAAGGKIGLLSFIFLSPWMAVFLQSNGTPLYPPFKGNMNPDYAVLASKEGFIADLIHTTTYFLTPEALVLLACLALTLLHKNRTLARSAFAATIIISWMIAFRFGVGIISELYRYTFPIMFPVALWAMIRCLDEGGQESPSAPDNIVNPRRLPVLACCVMLLAVGLPKGSLEWQAAVQTLPSQTVSLNSLVHPAIKSAIIDLQNLTPVGSKIFVAVDTPYLLDFRRNEIFTMDVAGGSAPNPWPLEKGPEALRQYLLDHGFRYVLAVDFDNAMLLYTRRHWKEHHRPEWFFKEVWGRYMLDFMDNLDSLALGNGLLAKKANLRLIDLNPNKR